MANHYMENKHCLVKKMFGSLFRFASKSKANQRLWKVVRYHGKMLFIDIDWNYPPPSNSHQKDYSTCSRESLQAFICDCYWVEVRAKISKCLVVKMYALIRCLDHCIGINLSVSDVKVEWFGWCAKSNCISRWYWLILWIVSHELS